MCILKKGEWTECEKLQLSSDECGMQRHPLWCSSSPRCIPWPVSWWGK